jgi:glucose-1-phosphate adenylyltransferase
MQRFLPASKVSGTLVQRAIIADGCIITATHIDRAVIGIRSAIQSVTTIRNSVIMGADFYPEKVPKRKTGNPPLGIGRHCHIEDAIYRQERTPWGRGRDHLQG